MSTTSFSLPAGAAVGSYRIVRALGQGGMGAVFLAEHRHLPGKQVAIKFIGDPARATSESVARFRREAETLARLDHPHVIEELDFGFHDVDDLAVPYLVMEFLPGGDLEQLLARRGRLSLAETRRILLPILDALEHAHQRGVIHRDLKPANILFDASGRPKLADFGLVSRDGAASAESGLQLSAGSGPLTQAGFAVGTPGYMSPEQVAGEPLDASTDLYTLGLIYFRCLVGRLPGVQETPSRADPAIPAAADRFFVRCVAPRAERPKSAAALRPLLAPPSGPKALPAKPAAPNPAPLARLRALRAPAALPLGARVALGALCGAVPGVVTGLTLTVALELSSVWLLVIPLWALLGGALGTALPWISRRSQPLLQPSGWLAHCARCAIPVIVSQSCCPVCGSRLERSA